MLTGKRHKSLKSGILFLFFVHLFIALVQTCPVTPECFPPVDSEGHNQTCWLEAQFLRDQMLQESKRPTGFAKSGIANVINQATVFVCECHKFLSIYSTGCRY
jgi:hypothetical protein